MAEPNDNVDTCDICECEIKYPSTACFTDDDEIFCKECAEDGF